MSGTKAGGLKAAATNKQRYGENFYRDMGRKGGQNGHTGGFAANPALAKIAGSKGGKISRRGAADKTKKIIEANRDEIIDMACDGIYIEKIAKRFGVSAGVLDKWLDENL